MKVGRADAEAHGTTAPMLLVEVSVPAAPRESVIARQRVRRMKHVRI
jgi:hypothetical protein